MAQELHDGVGHGLAVIAMQAGVGLHVLDRDPAAARTALEAIRDSARESLDALRCGAGPLPGAQISGECRAAPAAVRAWPTSTRWSTGSAPPASPSS